MATWKGLRSYINSKYTVADDQPEYLRLVFDLAGGRSQLVIVRKMMLGDDEWAEIASPVGPVAGIDPLEALKTSGQVVVGGLALADWDESLVVFRHSFPIKNLDEDEFEVPFRVVTAYADQLEQQLIGGDKY